MPQRFTCIAILVLWVVAALSLFFRDVLPEMVVGPPPDLRSIANAGSKLEPTHWAIEVADDPKAPRVLRSVGRVETRTITKRDGCTALTSSAVFDAADLLKKTAFAIPRGGVIEIRGVCDIDKASNLFHFRATVRVERERNDLLVLEGRLKGNAIEVTSRGDLSLMNWTRSFPYQARGMVQNDLGPIDRLPGLHAGQRWESQVVSPLSGQVEVVRCEVSARPVVITWNDGPVTTLEVVSRASAWTFRTWVRADGLVLRQEVPFPLGKVKVFLERIADEGTVLRTPGP